jgi:hypothetical protein
MATVSNSNFMTFTNFNTTNLEANASTIEVIAADNRREKITLEEIIDEHNIRVKEDLSEMTSEGTKEANVYIDNQLFIYGQVVHDFVFSKKLLYGQSPQQPSNRWIKKFKLSKPEFWRWKLSSQICNFQLS